MGGWCVTVPTSGQVRRGRSRTPYYTDIHCFSGNQPGGKNTDESKEELHVSQGCCCHRRPNANIKNNKSNSNKVLIRNVKRLTARIIGVCVRYQTSGQVRLCGSFRVCLIMSCKLPVTCRRWFCLYVASSLLMQGRRDLVQVTWCWI